MYFTLERELIVNMQEEGNILVDNIIKSTLCIQRNKVK